MTNLFNTFFYQPLLNALVLLYEVIPGGNLGMAIILLTLLIRTLLFPLNLKSIKSQKAISELEPKIKTVRSKFKDNKERLAQETMKLYREANINPFSGIFLILIQLPVLFALYKVFSKGVFFDDLAGLYSFVSHPGQISPQFLVLDLSQPNSLLSVLAGVSQFFQTKMQSFKPKSETKKSFDFSQVLQKQMLYFFPLFTFLVLLRLPSAISLYLVASSAFSILQILYVDKLKPPKVKN